jgi:hypothetical protein
MLEALVEGLRTQFEARIIACEEALAEGLKTQAEALNRIIDYINSG